MRPTDPRIQATLNSLSTTLESTSQTTRTYLYSASKGAEPYLTSCLASVSSCLEASCQPCFSARDGSRRRHHPSRLGPSRARGGRDGVFGAGFEFYDDWEREEEGWGEDELERLLSGEEDDGGRNRQPKKRGAMSYGSRLGGERALGKRKAKEIGEGDPDVVPQSSMFGFLERLPWKIGGRGNGRYRPSIADLQEGVGRRGVADTGAGAALLESESEDERGREGRRRKGSSGSKTTTNSLSSRGDLFPSDDEADAVPLDDEFEAMMLERRNTATMSDAHSNENKSSRKSIGSRSSTKTEVSEATLPKKKGKKRSPSSSVASDEVHKAAETEIPSLETLQLEEEEIGKEEESLIEKKRLAALELARSRGLVDDSGKDASERHGKDMTKDAPGSPQATLQAEVPEGMRPGNPNIPDDPPSR